MSKTESGFGFASTTPPLGPFPVTDDLGMKAAVAILDKSLDPGDYSNCVQWATFRKTMSSITNLSQASVGRLKDSMDAYQRKKMWIPTSVSHQFWFSRFIEGVHKRVGEVRREDEAIIIDVLQEVNRLFELEWQRNGRSNRREMRKISEMGVWFIVGYCTGMRGEEMVLIELAGTRNSLEYIRKDEGYFKLVISGRTKGNQLLGSKFSFPLANNTSGTGLDLGTWIKRLISIRDDEGNLGGRLFYRGTIPAKVHQ